MSAPVWPGHAPAGSDEVRSTSPDASSNGGYHTHDRHVAEAATPSMGFSFTSLSHVWESLKTAAALEIGGFVKALSGGEMGQVDEEHGHAGQKRSRTVEQQQTTMKGRATGSKRRKVRSGNEFLFDGVPPLMPPIADSSWYNDREASKSSSPVANRSSVSPAATRRFLWPRKDADYADKLLRSKVSNEGLSTAFAPIASSSKSLLHRRNASGAGSTTGGTPKAQVAHGSTSFLPRATALLSVATPWSIGQQLLSGSPSSSAPAVALAPKSTGRPARRSLADELGDDDMSCSPATEENVSDEWNGAEGRERGAERSRITALEDEVSRLKQELLVQKALASPSSAFSKTPRVSTAPPPPPPPAPPPPPSGKPHPMLLSARAKLRATPERPKRRHSSVAASVGLDMTALMTEVGAKRQKLRKVGLPKERTQEELRQHKIGQAGAFEVGLRSALKRTAARQSYAVPPTEARARESLLRRSSGASVDDSGSMHSAAGPAGIRALADRGGIATSASAPELLSQIPSKALEGEPAGSSGDAELPPSTEVDAVSKTGDSPAGDAGSLGHTEFESSETADLPKKGAGSDAPGITAHDEAVMAIETEPEALRRVRLAVTAPSSPATTNGALATHHHSLSSPMDRTTTGGRLRECASAEKLPGLDLTHRRPITPGRQKAKANRAVQSSLFGGPALGETGSGDLYEYGGSRPPLSPRPNATEPSASASPAKKPRRARRVAVPRPVESEADAKPDPIEVLLATAESTLSGVGTKDPDPARVFGRA